MKTITITTQDELDAIPTSFQERTIIEIRCSEKIIIKTRINNSSVVARDNSSVEARGNSYVVARGNSYVVAWDNSSVEAWDNSSVEAWDNSSVEAWGNSSVEAWDNSSVEAWGNSYVVARDNSSVVARGNSSVVAWDNSSVEARGNSYVVARGNSYVVAWDNSSVEAWDNSSVELFISAYVIVLSSTVIIKKLLDYSTAVFKGVPIKVEEKSDTAMAREIPSTIYVSFDEWIRRGYVSADGITKKLKSQRRLGNLDIFECQTFPNKPTSYVVKRGDIFSHGETVEKAIEDLRYKVGNRDASEFNKWRENLDGKVSFDEAVAAYRVVTGACELGVKEFIKSINVPDILTPKVILDLTRNEYGHDRFKKFLEDDNI